MDSETIENLTKEEKPKKDDNLKKEDKNEGPKKDTALSKKVKAASKSVSKQAAEKQK